MDVIELIPRLHFIRFPIGHVYLWEDPDGLTLVDSGVAGSAPSIAEAVRGLGHETGDVRRLFLTHFHEDHVGSAAEIAAWGDVEVYAGRADAPVIRGEAAGPPPRFLDWERPIYEDAKARMPTGPPAPVRVDHELDDGDEPGFGGGARVVGVPGHTPGSVALYLPAPGVLFTGDTVARMEDGPVILGVLNVDPVLAAESLRSMAGLDTEVVCFGHGEPVTRGGTSELREAAARLPR